MPRWDWTWEERSPNAAAKEPPSTPAGQGRSSGGPDPVFRRRRAVAIITLALVVVVLVAAFSLLAPEGNSRKPARSPRVVHTVTAAQRDAARARAEENAINHVLSYTPAVTSGGSHGDEVALTFDDGPGPYTRQLVGVLNSLHVKATFFAIGKEEQYFSSGTLEELRSGDVVGDHTETHPMMALLSRHEQYEELLEQIDRIELLGGPRPRLFRPPYGSFNATTFKQLRHLHLLMILWSTDTADYTLPGTQAIVERALAGVHPGSIILMHDAGGDRSETIAALPAIVRGLRERGLHPVTIPRLLLDDPPPPNQPIPTSLVGG